MNDLLLGICSSIEALAYGISCRGATLVADMNCYPLALVVLSFHVIETRKGRRKRKVVGLRVAYHMRIFVTCTRVENIVEMEMVD